MTTGRIVALYDASVLYPGALRDLLVRLALVEAVRARWSDTIHEEWISSLLRNRPDLTRTRLERTRERMERALPDARVVASKAGSPCWVSPIPVTATFWRRRSRRTPT